MRKLLFLLIAAGAALNAQARPMREGEVPPAQYSIPLSEAPESAVPADVPAEGEQNEPSPLPLPLKSAPAPEPQARRTVSAAPPAAVPFSRTVSAAVGQQLEIPFGGSGWVFLGELSSQKGITYTSHRLDAEGQSFLFKLEKEGTYSLSFYKQDFIRDYILNDTIQVVVSEALAPLVSGNQAVGQTIVRASPRWPSAAEEAALIDAAAMGLARAPLSGAPASLPPQAAAPTGTAGNPAAVPVGTPERAASVPETSGTPDVGAAPETAGVAAASPPASPQGEPEGQEPPPNPLEYLQKAQAAFDANDLAGALAALDQFRAEYPAGSAEAWWLYAQMLEADSPAKDIRAARDYYSRLVKEYPLSPHFTDAQRRISYLDRYYFNIQ